MSTRRAAVPYSGRFAPPAAFEPPPDAAPHPLMALVRRALLVVILLLSAALQLYRLNDWQYFSDDQATQLNVMHGLLVDHHLPLQGLALSVGQAHIGPLFYYMLALPLWLGHLDPTAGVVMIGAFQVATVYLLYRLCLHLGLPWAGLCVAALYASSELVVYWSRFLWPNTAPFFVVLALYAAVALGQGRARYLILLAGSLAAVVQMQPTAALLLPVLGIWVTALVALRRLRVTVGTLALALGLVVLLAAPTIVYDLSHSFAETRAWLAYATTVQPGAGGQRGLRHGIDAFELVAWRLVGVRTRGPVDLLLGLAVVAIVLSASGRLGAERALLARLLLLTGAVYLLAFSLYRGTLHPHYAEPIYAVPFLAIALLFDLVVSAPSLVSRTIRLRDSVPNAGPPPPASWLAVAVQGFAVAGTALVVLGLVITNVRQLQANSFALDSYQLDSPAETQGNQTGLGEMRAAIDRIGRAAAERPYDLLLAVRDGGGGGFHYLAHHSSHPPATVPNLPLQYLLVQPADRPPWLWPTATRARWSGATGGYIRLPHLLLWRLWSAPGHPPPPVGGGWRTTADVAGPVTAVALIPGRPHTLLIGAIGGPGLSRDGGRHRHAVRWPTGANGLAAISGFAESTDCPRRLYAATFAGVVVSADGGRRWTVPAGRQPSPEILSIVTPPRTCGTVLAGTRLGIARSTDGGRHWTLIAIGRGHRLAVHALVVGSDRRTIYAGTTDGVWESRDRGAHWQTRSVRGEPRPALSLLAHPLGRPILLAGSGGGVVYSGDGGRTWAPTGAGLQGVVYTLLADARTGTLLAGTDAGLYRSSTVGRSWRRLAVPPDLTVSALTSGDRQTLYAATNRGLYRSLDGGLTWALL